MPLGGNVVRRDLGEDDMLAITKYTKSIELQSTTQMKH